MQDDRDAGDPDGRRTRRSRSRIQARCCFPEQATRSSTSLATISPSRTAPCVRAGGRPNVLVRYPDGIDGEFFFQKRAPKSRPDWIDVVTLRFPSGRVAEEVVPRDAAALVWMANLACLELHPHPVRADDLDHPDELRVDLDPVRGVPFADVRTVAHVLRGHARRFRTRWMAEDIGLSRHSCQRAHRAEVDLRPGAACGARARARSGAAGAGVGDEQMVERRTARRVSRLQPEREGSHGGRSVLGASHARCARVGAVDVGRNRIGGAGRFHARLDAAALRAPRRRPCRDRSTPVLARPPARAFSATGT